MTEVKETEKFVLMQSGHWGFVRETFAKGTVIEVDRENRTMKIDGRKFDTIKDFEILERHNQVVPYSEEVEEDAKRTSVPVVQPNPKEAEKVDLPIVQSDQDNMGADIDISHTKTQVRKAQQEAERQANKTDDLPIIKQDESPQERLARLQSEIPKMPVVKDDSLGDIGGTSLNAGAVKVHTAEEIEAMRKEAAEKVAEKATIDASPVDVSSDAAPANAVVNNQDTVDVPETPEEASVETVDVPEVASVDVSSDDQLADAVNEVMSIADESVDTESETVEVPAVTVSQRAEGGSIKRA